MFICRSYDQKTKWLFLEHGVPGTTIIIATIAIIYFSNNAHITRYQCQVLQKQLNPKKQGPIKASAGPGAVANAGPHIYSIKIFHSHQLRPPKTASHPAPPLMRHCVKGSIANYAAAAILNYSTKSVIIQHLPLSKNILRHS